mmetsp:Transcript_121818/g.272001  ORF Transcript_121818/g.272001 Transcript_121818/m.272001 type:complete len:219 (+) Transcript_121818:580-1236(+)
MVSAAFRMSGESAKNLMMACRTCSRSAETRLARRSACWAKSTSTRSTVRASAFRSKSVSAARESSFSSWLRSPVRSSWVSSSTLARSESPTSCSSGGWFPALLLSWMCEKCWSFACHPWWYSHHTTSSRNHPRSAPWTPRSRPLSARNWRPPHKRCKRGCPGLQSRPSCSRSRPPPWVLLKWWSSSHPPQSSTANSLPPSCRGGRRPPQSSHKTTRHR